MKSTETVRRLSKLAELLDYLPEERFNYNHWVGSGYGGDPKLSCGTTACALGWATTIQEFREEGLRLVSIDGYTTVVMGPIGEESVRGGLPRKAAMEAFGLTDEEARWLFFPDGDYVNVDEMVSSSGVTWDNASLLDGYDAPTEGANAVEVADHIRHFIKAKYGVYVPAHSTPGWIREILRGAAAAPCAVK